MTRSPSSALLLACLPVFLMLAGCAGTPDRPDGGRSWGVSRITNDFTGKHSLKFGPYSIDMRDTTPNRFKRDLIDAAISCSTPDCATHKPLTARPFDFTVHAGETATEGECHGDAMRFECRVGDSVLLNDGLAAGAQWHADTPSGALRIEEVRQVPEIDGLRFPEWRILDDSGQWVAHLQETGTDSERRSADYRSSYRIWLADMPQAQRDDVARIAAVLLGFSD